MGNSNSTIKHSEKKSPISYPDRVNTLIEHAYVKLVGNTTDHLTFAHLTKVFSDGLAESLWRFLSQSESLDGKLTIDDFARDVAGLWETSTDIYVKICQPVFHFIKLCAEAAGAGAVAGDEQFISDLARNMSGKCSSVEEIIEWKRAVCPAFCNALQAHVLHVLLDREHIMTDYSSEILSPMQMWYIHCCLPNAFFPTAKDSTSCTPCHWTPLYSSAIHGISVNRFEHNVFDYKGPTVSVFLLSDKRIFVLTTEDTWRHSVNRYGGPLTRLFQISPNLMVWSSPSPIYSNFKIRSSVCGISFSDVLKIDNELGNVAAIEVWGCASYNALEEQQRLRIWQNKQAEKNKKVPLPGNWDDNPDKSILEMAGFQFSDERRKMELEKIS